MATKKKKESEEVVNDKEFQEQDQEPEQEGKPLVGAQVEIKGTPKGKKKKKPSIRIQGEDAEEVRNIMNRVVGDEEGIDDEDFDNIPEDKFGKLLRNPKYEIVVERDFPRKWEGRDITGEIARFMTPMSMADVRRAIQDEFGGRRYRVSVCTSGGEVIDARKITIASDPIIEDSAETNIHEFGAEGEGLPYAKGDPEELELENLDRDYEIEVKRQRIKDLRERIHGKKDDGESLQDIVSKNDEKWEKRLEKTERDREEDKRAHKEEVAKLQEEKRYDALAAERSKEKAEHTREMAELKESIKDLSSQPKEDTGAKLMLKQMELQIAQAKESSDRQADTTQSMMKMLSDQGANNIKVLMEVVASKGEKEDSFTATEKLINIASGLAGLKGGDGDGAPESLEAAIAQALPKGLELLAKSAESGALGKKQMEEAAMKMAREITMHTNKTIKEEAKKNRGHANPQPVTQPAPVRAAAQSEVENTQEIEMAAQKLKTVVSSGGVIGIKKHRQLLVNKVLMLMEHDLDIQPKVPEWTRIAWFELPKDIREKIIFAHTDEDIHDAIKDEADPVLLNRIWERIAVDQGLKDYVVEGIEQIKEWYRAEQGIEDEHEDSEDDNDLPEQEQEDTGDPEPEQPGEVPETTNTEQEQENTKDPEPEQPEEVPDVTNIDQEQKDTKTLEPEKTEKIPAAMGAGVTPSEPVKEGE